MSQQAGNEENKARVKDMMEQAQEVNLGEKATEGVKVDYTTTFGSRFQGVVIFKRPSMQDYMKMGSIKARLLGASGSVDLKMVDGTIKFMAQVMSTLQVVIVKAPEWLIRDGRISVEHIEEPDVLYHLYDQYEKWEETFRKPVQGDVPGGSEATD